MGQSHGLDPDLAPGEHKGLFLMVLCCRMMRVEWIEGLQLPTVEGDFHTTFPTLPAGDETVENELNMIRRLV